jgi:hypothetical protein
VIEKLPVNELADEEICKLFFERFGAKALVMVYLTDEEELPAVYGRFRTRGKGLTRYRRLLEHFENAYGYATNSRFIAEEEF